MSGKAIHDDMLATLGDNAPAYSVVKSWLADFKCGRNSNSKGVIMTDYLSKRSTVTGAYCAYELRKLREALKSKRREKLRC